MLRRCFLWDNKLKSVMTLFGTMELPLVSPRNCWCRVARWWRGENSSAQLRDREPPVKPPFTLFLSLDGRGRRDGFVTIVAQCPVLPGMPNVSSSSFSASPRVRRNTGGMDKARSVIHGLSSSCPFRPVSSCHHLLVRSATNSDSWRTSWLQFLRVCLELQMAVRSEFVEDFTMSSRLVLTELQTDVKLRWRGRSSRWLHCLSALSCLCLSAPNCRRWGTPRSFVGS